ncbi:MAG TPA: hypothetical protein V6D05_15365 [Stenomitos sp.]
MNMRKLIGTASCSLMALSILVQPALAQVPNPGAGWVLVKQRNVRTFAADPAKPGGGAWKLVDVKTRTYFIEDGKSSRSVANSNKETQEVALGQGPKVYGDETVQSTKNGEAVLGDVPNSKATYYDRDYLVSFKLTRYSLFQDVSGYKPWTIYNQAAVKTRNVNYYLVEWTDPITNERLSEVDPAPEYTDWVVGSAYNKSVASTGKDNFSRRDDKGTEDRRIILGKTYSPQTSLADVAKNPTKAKASSFLSDSGAGNTKTSLSGSKTRVAFKADEAVASTAKKSDQGGSITDTRTTPPTSASSSNANQSNTAASAAAAPTLLDKVLGSWQLSGGSKSSISFDREGKSNNVKVKVHLDIIGGADFNDDFNTAFSQTMKDSKDKRTVALSFSDDGTKLYVTLGLIKATFVKK